MPLTEKHIKQFACFYLLCFVINYCLLWHSGLLFSLIEPVFFTNRLDFTLNLLLMSDIQHYLLKYSSLRVCFDVIYLILPFLLTVAVIKQQVIHRPIAFFTVLFTIIYNLLLSTVTYTSIEGALGFMLCPVILSAVTVSGFYFNLHSVRIIFLLAFFSAGLLKLRSLAVFNTEQMAGILLLQHNAYLVSNPWDWFTKTVNYLVEHKQMSYSFYLGATVAELVFAVGLFTRKYDRVLIWIFCIFLLFDYFLMRINYFSWMVFMACFYFSSLKRKSTPYSNHLS